MLALGDSQDAGFGRVSLEWLQDSKPFVQAD